MTEGTISIRVELLPEPEAFRPRVVAIAAAIGRAPLLSDFEDMAPPRAVMLLYPPPPQEAAEYAARARFALGDGGTVALFVSPQAAAGAERWLRSLRIGGAADGR